MLTTTLDEWVSIRRICVELVRYLEVNFGLYYVWQLNWKQQACFVFNFNSFQFSI
jgi:hypothetical protein